MSLSISSQGKPQHSTGALDDQQLLAIEGSKKSRQGGHSTSNWTECKKCRKPRRKPPLHRHNCHKRKLSTGTVRTLSMNCKCGKSAVFCTVTTSTCCCTPTGMQQPCPRTGGSQRFSQRSATVGAACLLHNWHRRNLYDLHNKDIDHLVNELQQRNLYGLQNRRKNGDLALRHDRDLTTLSTNCSCTHLSLYSNGHVDNLQELHLEHCGDLSLQHNWNVHHIDGGLDLRHLQVFVRHELLEFEKHDHRHVHNECRPPLTSAPLSNPHHPGTHFGAPGRRPRLK